MLVTSVLNSAHARLRNCEGFNLYAKHMLLELFDLLHLAFSLLDFLVRSRQSQNIELRVRSWNAIGELKRPQLQWWRKHVT